MTVRKFQDHMLGQKNSRRKTYGSKASIPTSSSRGESEDKFREECGVFAILGHSEAARLTYLGLYALQHRGQESAGITSTDGERLHSQKGMGYVGEVFTEKVMAELPGSSAIGHTRYSTAGDTNIQNAQPLQVDCVKGQIAVAHNGNLANAVQIRKKIESDGSIFQTTSGSDG